MIHFSKPKFKETIPFFLLDGEIQIGEEEGVASFVEDPNGSISLLVRLLDGHHDIDEIVQCVQQHFPEIAEHEILAGISVLADSGFLEEATILPHRISDGDRERYRANLNYFSLFTEYGGNKYALQERIQQARIALLGVGGLGSQILYHLAALGFRQVKALDFDVLEVSNFNRQLLYSETDIGQPKVEMAKKRISQFNSDLNLLITNKKLESSHDVFEHIRDCEYVVCVADRPTLDIQNWVNEAVVRAALPLVSGGVLNTRGRFYSMIPQETGCVQCHMDSLAVDDARQQAMLRFMRSTDFQRKNAAISPNVAMLAGIMVKELVKIVTKIEEPLSLGRVMEFDFLTYGTSELSAWSRRSECPVCGTQAAVESEVLSVGN